MTKEKFKKYITNIKRGYDCENEIYEVSKKWCYSGVLFDTTSFGSTFLATDVLELIGVAFGFPKNEDILSWWCWDKDFGETFNEGDIEDYDLPEDHKYRKPILKTIEELYDYCVFLAEQYKKETNK